MLRYAVVLFLLVKCSLGIIYKMNASEYNRMPPLYHLDNFDSCLVEPGGTYCVMDVDLYGDNDLMKTIRGYSAHTMKHYNHTQIHRGVCVTTTCKHFLHEEYTESDLANTLEACQNESLWNEYKIEGKLAQLKYCKRQSDKLSLDWSDIVVAVVYLIVMMLNVIGSFYDIILFSKDENGGNRFLMNFSIRRNWARLVAPVDTSDPRLERLKLFHGLRALTMIGVFFSHTVLIMAHAYVANPYYIESTYEDPLKQLLFNGSLVTHTFFVMSAFLLAYNFQLHAERNSVNWLQWPKGMLQRWLRLTPTYALILATICTIMRYFGTGPMWDLVVTSEADACRKYWWAHIFYFNNYVYDDALCAPQSWYLAADTQLFGLGLLVCLVARQPRSQVICLVLLFIASLLISAGHTYFEDLNAVVIQTPELYRNFYATDDTFRLVYARGHTNISTYSLGLAGGFLTYHWQKQRKDFQKYKNHRWAYWLVFPIGVLVVLSGGLFYTDGGHTPLAFKIIYASVYKPVFQAVVVIFIIGVVFKFETVYRAIVEWRGFTWMGRTSYSAFLLHTLFQRGFVGMLRQPVHISDYFVVMILSATVFLTFMAAAALWLLVECPLVGLIKLAMGGQKPRDKMKPETTDKPEINEAENEENGVGGERSKV